MPNRPMRSRTRWMTLVGIVTLAAGTLIAAPSATAAPPASTLVMTPAGGTLQAGVPQQIVVTNTASKGATRVLATTLTAAPTGAPFDVVDGCAGTALGPGKSCAIQITFTGEIGPDPQALTVTVGGKGGASVSGSWEVPAATGCARNTAGGLPSDDLQSLIDAAAPGDTLRVSGTCYGTFSITDDLTLEGATADATLDAQGAGRVLSVTGATVAVRGLAITHGVAAGTTSGDDYGGGLFNHDGDVSLTDVVVSGNSARIGGGVAAHGDAAVTTITDSQIVDNTGSAIGGGIAAIFGDLVLHRTRVESNDSSLFGGGVIGSSATLTISESEIVGNTTAYSGGGVIIEAGYLEITDTEISANVAGEGGGVATICQGAASVVVLRSAVVSANSAVGGFGEGSAGGLLNCAGTMTLHDTSVTGNTSVGVGGGSLTAAGTTLLRGTTTVTGNTSPAPSGIAGYSAILHACDASGATPFTGTLEDSMEPVPITCAAPTP